MLTMKSFIVYYPESTADVKAERRRVEMFVEQKGTILREFSDEPGSVELPELPKAIACAVKRKAVLLIPELTLTEQSVRLLQQLKNSSVLYHFIVMPDSNALVHWVLNDVFPKASRDERSQRARAAMQAARERGVKLGTPGNLTPEAQQKGVRARQENARNDENNRHAAEYCAGYLVEGKSFDGTADT
jgi:hypothetical protein